VAPAFKLRAFGELIEARVQVAAAYGETELEVRADGMSPPLVVLPPAGPGKKARCVRADVLAQQEAVEKVRELGFVPDEEGKGLVCRGDDAIARKSASSSAEHGKRGIGANFISSPL
jgi:hypothetical protein